MSVQTQNSRGEWVPAIPLPLSLPAIGWRVKCGCGAVRRGLTLRSAQRRYREHYALVHILALS